MAQQLLDYFPTLPVADFVQSFRTFEPDLWEDRDGLWLDYADLVRLTQRLARSPPDSELVPPLYGLDAYYLVDFLDSNTRAPTALLAERQADT